MLTPLDLPDTEFDMVGQRKRYGEDLTGKTIDYDGKKMQLLWGQFHEHSDISQCVRGRDLSAQDSYGYHRDIHREDFCAVTDHGYNMSEVIWHYLSKTARTQHDPHRFTTFLGLEWTGQFGNGGHRNLIFKDTRFPRWFNAKDGMKPTDVWAELQKMNANFIHVPHQLADTSLSPVNWDYVDEVFQPLAEIFQVRGSYEHRGCPRQAGSSPRGDGHFLQDAWARDIVIGVIASPDHGGGLGKAAVFATENTREAILDACRKRHTYGTTAAKIFLDVRVNGRLMGEKIEAQGKPVRIHVKVVGTAPLEKIQICRSNTFIHTRQCDSDECVFDWEDPDPLPGKSYYYVRVLQQSVQHHRNPRCRR